MKVNPPTYAKDNYKCFFCGNSLEFLLSESMGEGIHFVCLKCNKRYLITELK